MESDYATTIAERAGMSHQRVEVLLATWATAKLQAEYEYVQECFNKMEESLKRQGVADVENKIKKLQTELDAMTNRIGEDLQVIIQILQRLTSLELC